MSPRTGYHVLLAWVLPGLGHLAQGRRGKALYFGCLVLLMYALGILLGEGASVSATRYPYHFYGQSLAGLPVLIGNMLGSTPAGETILRLELGVLFSTVAGILNLVVMVDVYEFARRGGAAAGTGGAPTGASR
ncbi:MAG: hypothetical protein DHS20C15_10160 [Planctomycetota bacterium]|nr:MAG: hypothetical protein DHS20C15_10160 [Planctomycetota bacterium]